MIVYKLPSIEKKDSLLGVDFIKDNTFNPKEDAKGNWVISKEEVEQCSIDWVKNLTPIEWEPKQTESIF